MDNLHVEKNLRKISSEDQLYRFYRYSLIIDFSVLLKHAPSVLRKIANLLFEKIPKKSAIGIGQQIVGFDLHEINFCS